MNKSKLSLIGFCQALAVIGYCGLISGFFWYMGKEIPQAPGFLGTTLILALLVFSVAVTGSLVFGYPAYLALNGKIKPALKLLAYTLLYFLGLMAIVLVVLASLS